jgi:ureidoglycolate lyase
MQNNKPIIPKTLTRENFTQFGDVIEVNENAKNFNINDGFTRPYLD